MISPIVEYKEKHGLTWEALVQETGLSRMLLYKLRTPSLDTLLHLQLSTVLKLKRSIGVDLLAYVDSKINKGKRR